MTTPKTPGQFTPRFRVMHKVFGDRVRHCVWDRFGRMPNDKDYRYTSIITAKRKAREANASIGL